MGMVETVPGVSSSTVAILTGIYEKLIQALSHLASKRWKEGISFLIPIGIGMIVGFAISILAVSYLLEHFKMPTHYLFMGMVLGIVPVLWTTSQKEVQGSFKPSHYIIIVIAIIAVAATRFVGEPNEGIMTNLNSMDYVYLFISGWLASTALILPGISGALIFMILGVYYTAINAIKTMDFTIIIAVGLGVVAGVLITSKIVRFLLRRYTLIMYSLMIGLVAGSIVVLYPGVPSNFMYFLLCLCTMTIGFSIAYMTGRITRQ